MPHLTINSGTKAFSSLISSVGLSILHQRLKAHSILITNLLKYNSLLHRSIWSQPVSFSTIHFFEEPNPPKPIMAAMSGSTSSGSCWAACSLFFSFFFSLRCRFLSSSSCCCFIILSSKSCSVKVLGSFLFLSASNLFWTCSHKLLVKTNNRWAKKESWLKILIVQES